MSFLPLTLSPKHPGIPGHHLVSLLLSELLTEDTHWTQCCRFTSARRWCTRNSNKKNTDAFQGPIKGCQQWNSKTLLIVFQQLWQSVHQKVSWSICYREIWSYQKLQAEAQEKTVDENPDNSAAKVIFMTGWGCFSLTSFLIKAR